MWLFSIFDSLPTDQTDSFKLKLNKEDSVKQVPHTSCETQVLCIERCVCVSRLTVYSLPPGIKVTVLIFHFLEIEDI